MVLALRVILRVKMSSKKGVELTLNTIIILIIILVVFFIVVLFFSKTGGQLFAAIKERAVFSQELAKSVPRMP